MKVENYWGNKSLLLGSALLSPFVLAGIAQAQEQSNDDLTIHLDQSYDEELVAGRTIIHDFKLKEFNTITFEEHLNTLPMVMSGMTAFSNNPGDGTASVDLRGLGAERTLVLVNGHRFVGTNGEGRIDLNAIPTALVKKVVVDTNFGSARFGSSAISGVVNLQLDDDFIGNEIGATYEISEHGDGGKSEIYFKLGREFDSGRGQTMVFASYNKRDGVFAGERDFSSQANNDIGTGFVAFGSSGVPGTRLFDGFDFTNAGYGTDGTNCTAPVGGSTEGLSGTCTGGATFDANGNIIPWINAGANTSRYNHAPAHYLQIPQERYSLAAFGRYNIVDNLELKLSSIFSSNKVPIQLAPTPFFSTATIDLDNNPFLSPAARSTLMASAINNGQSTNSYQVFIGRRMVEVGPRRFEHEKQNLHLAADLSGKIFNDWSWDIHGHYSSEKMNIERKGLVSTPALQAAVFSGQCNIFGADVFSDTCVNMVARTSFENTTSQQYNIGSKITGDISFLRSPKAKNPGQLMLGVEYRKDKFDHKINNVFGRNEINGFTQAGPIEGTQDSYDVYGELYWPLMEDISGIEEFSLKGALRFSRLGRQGSASRSQFAPIIDFDNVLNNKPLSYQIGGEWAPSSDIRFHSSFDKSFRQPSIQELFAEQQNGFPGGTDPCTTPFNIATLCIANGVLPFLVGDPIIAPLPQLQALFGGNPNLVPEVSETFTIGLIIQPQEIPGLSLAVQYSDIEIENVVGNISPQALLTGCFVEAILPFCDRVHRRSYGSISFVDLTNGNFYRKKTSGFDVSIKQTIDLSASPKSFLNGDLDIDFFGSFLFENFENKLITSVDYTIGNRRRSSLADTNFNCVGYHEGQTGFCDEPLPKWKHSASAKYSDGDWSVTARWRYSSSTRIDNLNPDAPSPFFPFPLKFASETGAKHYFDLSGSWGINETVSLSAGVINMFGAAPPLFGDCCSEQANTFPSSYDPLGRKFFVSARANF